MTTPNFAIPMFHTRLIAINIPLRRAYWYGHFPISIRSTLINTVVLIVLFMHYLYFYFPWFLLAQGI